VWLLLIATSLDCIPTQLTVRLILWAALTPSQVAFCIQHQRLLQSRLANPCLCLLYLFVTPGLYNGIRFSSMLLHTLLRSLVISSPFLGLLGHCLSVPCPLSIMLVRIRSTLSWCFDLKKHPFSLITISILCDCYLNTGLLCSWLMVFAHHHRGCPINNLSWSQGLKSPVSTFHPALQCRLHQSWPAVITTSRSSFGLRLVNNPWHPRFAPFASRLHPSYRLLCLSQLYRWAASAESYHHNSVVDTSATLFTRSCSRLVQYPPATVFARHLHQWNA